MTRLVRGRDLKGLLVPGDEIHQTTLRDLDSFGFACRTRSVDDIRQIFRS